MKCWLRRMLAWLGPVCQDRTAVLYGWENGMAVPLRPVMDDYGIVTAWIPDPGVMAVAPSPPETDAPSAPEVPVLFGEDDTPPVSGGFNPSGVGGM